MKYPAYQRTAFVPMAQAKSHSTGCIPDSRFRANDKGTDKWCDVSHFTISAFVRGGTFAGLGGRRYLAGQRRWQAALARVFGAAVRGCRG
jgi:hypothetical protein